MNKTKLEEIYLSKYLIINLGKIFKNELIDAYLKFIKSIYDVNLEKTLKKYSKFYTLYNNKKIETLRKYVINELLKIKIDNNNKQIIEKELENIFNIFQYSFNDFKIILKSLYPNNLLLIEKIPPFKIGKEELSYNDLIKFNTCEEKYKENRAFIFSSNLEILPIDIDEKMKFSDLKGYKYQKEVLYNNTSALIQNKKVNNILLYGDAGCGKSTSVRALLNEFKEIKIVQIFKDNLINLDELYLKLSSLPYKFIIFADDISFDENDKNLSTTKAILEGALIQCPNNATIYATSNRRNLIKENFQTRIGDEVHRNDTLNEISSLSERFGIKLFFEKPNNEEYKEMVLEIAQDNNLNIEKEELLLKAQKYAIIKASRSPRIIKQLINNLLAGVDI